MTNFYQDCQSLSLGSQRSVFEDISKELIFKNYCKEEIFQREMEECNKSECRKCQKLMRMVFYLKTVTKQFGEKNSLLKQEIEMMCQNFMYILQLTSNNIINEVQSRLVKVLERKQCTILKQSKIINRLERESLTLLDGALEIKEAQGTINKMEDQIKQLEKQNGKLKQALQKSGLRTKQSSSESTAKGSSFREDNEMFMVQRVNKIESEASILQKKPSWRLSKKTTFGSEHFVSDSMKESLHTVWKPNMKELKKKIEKLKTQVLSQNL